MNMYVTNKGLQVGFIQLIGVSSASLLQIGDSVSISLQSMFDTPPESIIVGAFDQAGAAGEETE